MLIGKLGSRECRTQREHAEQDCHHPEPSACTDGTNRTAMQALDKRRISVHHNPSTGSQARPALANSTTSFSRPVDTVHRWIQGCKWQDCTPSKIQLNLTNTLALISEHLGLVFTQQDIGQFYSAKVKYHSWWTLPEFKALGHVALEAMPLIDLLDRSKEIFNLLQRWQKALLLQIAVTLALKRADVKELQSVKLVAAIC